MQKKQKYSWHHYWMELTGQPGEEEQKGGWVDVENGLYVSEKVGRKRSVGIAICYGLDGPGSNPGGGKIFRTCPDRLWSPPSLLYNDYRHSFPGVKRPDLTLTAHPI
jgi:hypothetical protein